MTLGSGERKVQASEGEAVGGKTIDISRIMEMIPHRYPFLMLDRVVDVVAGESAVGLKPVSINEAHFPGHFPRRPVLPGVLLSKADRKRAGWGKSVAVRLDPGGCTVIK